MNTQLNAFIVNLRPKQWTKNLLLFAGIIFARKLSESECVWRAVAAVGIFCLASGVIYVFNDIVDRDLDRRHPVKKNRPIASGKLPVSLAARLGFGLLVICLAAAWTLGELFLASVAFFFIWNWLYTRWLKKVAILDVTGIGMSFVIRASAGVLAILPSCPDVGISPWLLLCTFFLSLFLGFCKRRDEFLKIAQDNDETRPALRAYSEPMLSALIGSSFALTSVMYALYTIWPATVEQFGTRDLVYTLPFVLLGMGRYLYLVFLEEKGGRPHEILLIDWPLQLVVLGWVATAVKVIGI